MNNIIELNSVTKHYRRGSETITTRRLFLTGREIRGRACPRRRDTGTLLVDNQETSRLNDHDLTAIRALKIGFVFQQFFLLPTLTASENVQLPALFLRNGNKQQRAAELLERVHLGDRSRHLPSQLSGGEMQRVAVARALVNEPRILLADEPTGNLDSHNAEAILEIFRELNAAGLTVLIVTHNSELAQQARRVITLKDGQIV